MSLMPYRRRVGTHLPLHTVCGAHSLRPSGSCILWCVAKKPPSAGLNKQFLSLQVVGPSTAELLQGSSVVQLPAGASVAVSAGLLAGALVAAQERRSRRLEEAEASNLRLLATLNVKARSLAAT